MIVLISGGCKNGKSMLAQRIAKYFSAEKLKMYYIATMIPHDEEDRARISRHVADRAGWGFETVECGKDILTCLENTDKNGVFLLDSVTALMSNEMFRGSEIDLSAPACTAEALCAFAKSVRHVVLVSDFIYSDCERYDGSIEAYRRGLAYADRKICEIADTVIEMCAGKSTVIKGEMPI